MSPDLWDHKIRRRDASCQIYYWTVETEGISRFQLITSTHSVEIVKAKRENKSQFNHLGWVEFWEIEEGEILKYPDVINIILGWGKELKVSNNKELTINK